MKEKKSNAQKLFAYNKLVNEQKKQQQLQLQQSQNHNQSKSKPSRPPQPKLGPREANLIDLSPDELLNLTLQQKAIGGPARNDICLLDEPIDVPTELDYQQAAEEPEVRNPPPYQAPPKYTMTSSITSDPFDTSHIGSLSNQQNFLENLYENYSKTSQFENLNAINNNEPGIGENLYSNTDRSNLTNILGESRGNFGANQMNISTSSGATFGMNSNSSSIYSKNTNIYSSNVFNTSPPNANVNPPSSGANLQSNLQGTAGGVLNTANYNANSVTNSATEFRNSPTSFQFLNNSSASSNLMNAFNSLSISNEPQSQPLNDSLDVNVSVDTLDSPTRPEGASNINNTQVTPKKVDKTFLAELEKSIYKNSEALSVNLKTNETSPTKYYDFTPFQQQQFQQLQEQQIGRNYGSLGALNRGNLYGNQTVEQAVVYQNNTGVYSSNPGISEPTLDPATLEILGNYEVAPRPYESTGNIYNTIAGDVYGSVAGGNIYDVVSATPASTIYIPQNQIQQQAIYDEVAAYEELRPRPTRPAPAVPLSQQQIQRRLEKIGQQQNKVIDLMNELSVDNCREEEAKEALDSCNWDAGLAVRFFKVERLSK